MASYEPGELVAVEVTFTNRASVSAEDFKAQVEDALSVLADNLSGRLVSPPNAGDTGVIIGNG